jgi:nitrate/nitrite transport system permease protein
MKSRLSTLLLPMLGFGALLALWALSSATWSKNLPSPGKTWEVSR